MNNTWVTYRERRQETHCNPSVFKFFPKITEKLSVFQKMKNSLIEENLKYLKKIKYFKSTSQFGFQLVSVKSILKSFIPKFALSDWPQSSSVYVNDMEQSSALHFFSVSQLLYEVVEHLLLKQNWIRFIFKLKQLFTEVCL